MAFLAKIPLLNKFVKEDTFAWLWGKTKSVATWSGSILWLIGTATIPIHIASDTEKLAMTNLIALAYGVKTPAVNKSAMGAAGALGGLGGANVLGGDFGATH